LAGSEREGAGVSHFGGLVHTADGSTETRRGDNQISVSAASLLGLRNAGCRESRVTGSGTFIHRQQAFAAGDQNLDGFCKHLPIHHEAPHFQFRTSGRSSPYHKKGPLGRFRGLRQSQGSLKLSGERTALLDNRLTENDSVLDLAHNHYQ
jgi:hypothetical protein